MNERRDPSREVEVGEVSTGFTGKTAANLGKVDISDRVADTVHQLSDSTHPDQPGLKAWLAQLQDAIESDPALSTTQKIAGLEQVEVLAKLAQNVEPSDSANPGQGAIKILQGTASTLSSTATLPKACEQLLPLISEAMRITLPEGPDRV